jgi:hypothetical protein
MIRKNPNDSTDWQRVKYATPLDMKELRKVGAFDPPRRRVEKFQSKPLQFVVKLYTGEVVMRADCHVTLYSNGGILRLVYDMYIDGELRRFDYIVSLEKTQCRYGGSRWWAKCYHCGKRVRILYSSWRNPYFACRYCQKLRYDSQLPNKEPAFIKNLNEIDKVEELERRLERTRSPRKRALIESKLVRKAEELKRALKLIVKRKHVEWVKQRT